MPHTSHPAGQPELFPVATVPSEKEIFRWEIMVRGGEMLTVNGATLREAITEVGRAKGLTGQPETVYRNAHRLYKPEFVSKTAVRFLEQK